MPLLIEAHQLKPGMCLAEAFVWHERIMMTADTVLTEMDVKTMQARFAKHQFRIKDEQLDQAVDFEDDSYEREVAHSAQRKVATAMTEVQGRIATHSSLDKASVAIIRSAITDVIHYLESHPVMAALVDNYIGKEGYLPQRAGNVFYLAMMLGTAAHEYVAAERRRQTSRDPDPRVIRSLVPLGLGAMLMDVGMVPLADLYESDKPMTPENWQRIRQHPIDGAKMIPSEISATARMIVRTHHENYVGGGYPDGVPGSKLHVFSRIVRIADAYDAATSVRVYRDAKSATRVIWEMTVGPYRRFYDQELMKVFARLIQPFPIGSKIRLQDGRYAVVVRYNRDNPLAPWVIVAFDEKDRRIPDFALGQPRQLGSRYDLRASSFGDEDISYIYEAAPDAANMSRVGFWPSLFEAAYP